MDTAAPAVTISSPIVDRMAGDMSFVGLFSIIYGALTSLSIIGAIIGVPMIIAGLRLREAADNFRDYHRQGDSLALDRALERQKTYFTITKWIIIIALALMVLSFVIAIGTMMTTFASLM